jgi:hypothetical protein
VWQAILDQPLWSIPLDIVMTPEVVDSYGPSSYNYGSGSLPNSRPASTDSKATTNGPCFFEVPHASQNDDLMVRLLIVVPNPGGGRRADLISRCLANCMLRLRRDEMRANPLFGTNGSFRG